MRYGVRKKGRITLTSAKCEATHANAIQSATDNVQTPRHEVRIHTGPGESSSDLDCTLLLVNDDIIESDHGDLDASRRRKVGVGGMPRASDSKRCARRSKFSKLPYIPSQQARDSERRVLLQRAYYLR